MTFIHHQLSYATCVLFLAASSTFAELCSSLENVYDVEQSTLESDVRAFVDDLADHGLIEIT